MTEQLKNFVSRLVEGEPLDRREARTAMGEVMSGSAPPVLVAAFLTALHAKGETPAEVAGMVDAMREASVRVPGDFGDLLDTCGTGGDRAGTFNISTAVAFVVAAEGIKVAKHGNRSATSRSGGADVLEALGAQIELSPQGVARCLNLAGLAFLFAPRFNPGMRHVSPVRRELGFPTVFNLLGPLCNPMEPCFQVMGVYRADLQDLAATALAQLGCRRALIVHGEGGLDELSLAGPSRVLEVTGDRVREYIVHPRELGLASAPLSAVAGGDAADNARILTSILDGSRSGPPRDVVALNAAAAFVAAGRVKNLSAGCDLAQSILTEGAALKRLETFIEISRRADR